MKITKYPQSCLMVETNNKKILIDAGGIKHNSFYETDKELGFEPRTEEELIEYKRLIGMPLAEDYDELISSLKTDVGSVPSEPVLKKIRK